MNNNGNMQTSKPNTAAPRRGPFGLSLLKPRITGFLRI